MSVVSDTEEKDRSQVPSLEGLLLVVDAMDKMLHKIGFGGSKTSLTYIAQVGAHRVINR